MASWCAPELFYSAGTGWPPPPPPQGATRCGGTPPRPPKGTLLAVLSRRRRQVCWRRWRCSNGPARMLVSCEAEDRLAPPPSPRGSLRRRPAATATPSGLPAAGAGGPRPPPKGHAPGGRSAVAAGRQVCWRRWRCCNGLARMPVSCEAEGRLVPATLASGLLCGGGRLVRRDPQRARSWRC